MAKNSFLRKNQGQAVVEYILMMAVVVALIGLLSNGFKNGLVLLWERMAKDISAPCPKCPPPPEVRIR